MLVPTEILKYVKSKRKKTQIEPNLRHVVVLDHFIKTGLRMAQRNCVRFVVVFWLSGK